LNTYTLSTIVFLRIQCSIPVFDGLLEEPHNQVVMDLLFVMAHFHGLAKLGLHHDKTLEVMDAATKSLGEKLRAFNQTTCGAFDTKELRREYNARVRRAAAKPVPDRSRSATMAVPNADQSSSNNQVVPDSEVTPSSSETGQQPFIGTDDGNNSAGVRSNRVRLAKTLNLNTYKFHSLGDYVTTIRTYGTMESYSTESVRDLSHLLHMPLIYS
jgi:hypothetical protein